MKFLTKDQLIARGVKNLQEFGYPHCTAANITTDLVYREFFASMLRDARGKTVPGDCAINELLAEIAAQEDP